MSSSPRTTAGEEPSSVSCASKTYELKGTQTESDSEDCEAMETREENEGESLAHAEKFIKVEKEGAERVTVNREMLAHLPCPANVQVQSAQNRGIFYFPTQAIFTPRQPFPAFVSHPPCPQLRSIQRLSHKRKTIEALAEGALINAEEPMLFEETIVHAMTGIVVFDNFKMEVITDVLKKQSAVNTQLLENSDGLPTDGEHFLKIGSCYSLQQENDSTAKVQEAAHVLTTDSTGIATNTSTVTSDHTNTGTSTETTQTNLPAVSQTEGKLIRDNAGFESITTTSISSLSSNQNHSSLDVTNSSLNNALCKVTAYKTLSTAYEPPNASISSNNCDSGTANTSAGPESSKSICSVPKNTVDTTNDSLVKPAYVPKEIKMGSAELGLHECVNVKDICDKELTKWTSEDVARFVRSTDCSEYADTFIDQEIDGKALTLLNQDLLIQWMKLKLGPAMKLHIHILNLKKALHNMP